MRLALPIALLVAAAPTAAFADGISFLGEFRSAETAIEGDVGREIDTATLPQFGLALGLRSRNISALGSVDMLLLEPQDKTLDGDGMFSYGVGLELGAQLQTGRWEFYSRAGWRWRWMSGGGQVIRTCDQTGACSGGYWPDTPDYRSSGPTVALGVQLTNTRDPDAFFGLQLELRAEQMNIELPGRGVVDGMLISIGLGFTIGSKGAFR